MTNSPASSSDPFLALHPQVQRWIWDQQWQELRDIQARAIPVILDGGRDVIIAAATAAGKTEAAFLPLLSAIADDRAPGFKVLYVSPLKALINDQFRRLEDLCERLDLPIVRWHGDASAAAKRRAREAPAGVVLITPESLEALFVRRGPEMAGLFAPLRAVVIDELHALMGNVRGMQLQSLLHRLEAVLGRRVVRIGLSATLGDMARAADALRPSQGDEVEILQSAGSGAELKLQLRGYVKGGRDDEEGLAATRAITEHLFAYLRGSHNLVFAGSRNAVELYADQLRDLSDERAVPNEFFPHHGNLSRGLREDLEERLRQGTLPTTAVCTTTLELGIDIGAVESVAQIGAPMSIAGLRQRLGRSGRRPGKPAVLRLYVTEPALDARSHPLDRLRLDVVQGVAAIRLLLAKWIEPPPAGAPHLSTLLHQVMAVIAQHGGISARKGFDLLCRGGPFRTVAPSLFAALLRGMGERDLIEQAADGTLLLGREGERLVEHYSFYAVFATPEEYRVVSAGRTLGTMPVEQPPIPEHMIIFAGRRWTVVAVEPHDKVVEVTPAAGGVPPKFGGGDSGERHDRLAAEMRTVLLADDRPGYLDATATALLAEGRAAFAGLDLAHRSLVEVDDRVLLFPWVGSRKLFTLALALTQLGLKAKIESLALDIDDADPADIRQALTHLSTAPPPDPLALARLVPDRSADKYDSLIDDALLTEAYARSRVEAEAVPKMAEMLLGGID